VSARGYPPLASKVGGVGAGSARIASIASSSAWRVAWAMVQVSADATSAEMRKYTFRSSLVRLRALAIALPPRTKTDAADRHLTSRKGFLRLHMSIYTAIEICAHTISMAWSIHAKCSLEVSSRTSVSPETMVEIYVVPLRSRWERSGTDDDHDNIITWEWKAYASL
jgi:hypothetical protein